MFENLWKMKGRKIDRVFKAAIGILKISRKRSGTKLYKEQLGYRKKWFGNQLGQAEITQFE